MLKTVETTSKDTITWITNIKDQLDSTIVKVQKKAPKIYRKKLESIGIVESQKVGRETLYINKGLIELLKE